MADTLELKVTVTQKEADYVASKVASGEFKDEGELIRDCLEERAEKDAALERWLQTTVKSTLTRINQGSGRFYSIDEAEQYLEQRRAERKAAATA